MDMSNRHTISGLSSFAPGARGCPVGGTEMLDRLISWCVPSRALELRAPDAALTDVEQVLAPYKSEPPRLAEPTMIRPRAVPS